VCLEGVPDRVLNALEVVQSIPEVPGFREILQNEVWESGGTPEGYRGTWEITGVPLESPSLYGVATQHDDPVATARLCSQTEPCGFDG
jgi:hypothetical protein